MEEMILFSCHYCVSDETVSEVGGIMTYVDSIDMMMLTKNFNKPYFRRVLRAIKQEIPVHHFIVVDGYSTDGTVDVVKEFFGKGPR
jgi:hypothetical protein